MKKLYSLSVLLLICFFSIAQPGLSIANGTIFSVKSGESLSVDSLILIPSADMNFNNLNVTRSTTLSHLSSNPSITRAYKSSAAINNFSGTITIFYQQGELNGIAETGLVLSSYTGAMWQSFRSGVTRNTTSNMVSTNVANISLNELTLSSTLAALPLRWDAFSGSLQNNKVQLQFITYNEEQLSSFAVEKSSTGNIWSVSGPAIQPKNTAGPNKYSFKDAQSLTTKTYYRIKQVDVDGHFSYSPVIVMEPSGQRIIISKDAAGSSVTVYSNQSTIRQLQVWNADGQLLFHQNTGVNGNTYQLSISAFNRGTYTLKVQLEDGSTMTQRFTK